MESTKRTELSTEEKAIRGNNKRPAPMASEDGDASQASRAKIQRALFFGEAEADRIRREAAALPSGAYTTTDANEVARIFGKREHLEGLLHASECPREDGGCDGTSRCGEFKKLRRHALRYGDGEGGCLVPGCSCSRVLLFHYCLWKQERIRRWGQVAAANAKDGSNPTTQLEGGGEMAVEEDGTENVGPATPKAKNNGRNP